MNASNNTTLQSMAEIKNRYLFIKRVRRECCLPEMYDSSSVDKNNVEKNRIFCSNVLHLTTQNGIQCKQDANDNTELNSNHEQTPYREKGVREKETEESRIQKR